MGKDPAFLFYPNDWIGGTMGMTFEEKGAYVELLMMQFNRGHMTKHMIGQTVGHLWDKLEVKFRMDKEGKWYNERLDLEKEKRKNYSKSRRNNLLGKNQHTNKVGHMTSHMENENINEDVINIYTNKSSIVYKMFEIFKKSNLQYFEDTKKDSTAIYQIALKIAKTKGIEQNDLVNGKQDEVLKAWDKIVCFIVSDTWFAGRSLFDLNNEWQRLIQSMSNNNKNGQSATANKPSTSTARINAIKDF